MDYLREGIHLRGFAQIEPIVAYKNEAFTLFQDLMNTVWSDFARLIYNVEVTLQSEDGQSLPAAAAAAGNGAGGVQRLQYSGGTAEDQPSAYEGTVDEEGELVSTAVQQRRVEANEQLGRNDPCWCGSGKKFKKCHGA